jgi:hypothetical protein
MSLEKQSLERCEFFAEWMVKNEKIPI